MHKREDSAAAGRAGDLIPQSGRRPWGSRGNSPRRVRRAAALSCVFLALGVSSCLLERPETASRSFRSMGTVATVTLGGADAGRLGPATARVRGIFDRLDREMSSYRRDNAISRLSARAGAAPLAVPPDTWRVLRLSKHFGEATGGVFDVTAAPLVTLWGFDGAAAPDTLPSEQEIRARRRLVDYRRLALRDGTAYLPVKGMAVDVGGIAKGYAVDRAYEDCRRAGFRDFLIDFSGNIRASGRPRWGEEWEVGVRDPFDRSRLIGKLALAAGRALATSGSYERYVNISNQRFSHIIDPRTGYPVAGTASVTVLSPNAAAADALSTAFFVAGLPEAPKLLKEFSGSEILIVPDKYPVELWLTPGFARIFTPVPELAGKVKVIRPSP